MKTETVMVDSTRLGEQGLEWILGGGRRQQQETAMEAAQGVEKG